jgi:UPF0716 protein FxsA
MPLLVLLFIVVPIAELYVIIQVGQAIGVLPTIALLLADSVLGSMLLRSQGRAAWRRFNDVLAAGRPPAREVLDGALVIFGGALLLTPGFITDVLGLLLLAPPTRAIFRRLLVRALTRGVFVLRVASSMPGRSPGGRPAPNGGAQPDVSGTATELDPPPRFP